MYHSLTVNASTRTEINIPPINFVKEKSLDFAMCNPLDCCLT